MNLSKLVLRLVAGTCFFLATTNGVSATNLGPELADAVIVRVGSSSAYVKGVETPIDQQDAWIRPYTKTGTTYVPLRFLAEALGLQVQWEAGKVLLVGPSQQVTVDMQLSTSYRNRLFIPLRQVSEVLGQQVSWGGKGLIIVNTNAIDATESEVWAEVDNLFRPEQLVKPSIVSAQVVKATKTYSSWSYKARVTGSVASGEAVKIIKDRTRKWHYVATLDNQPLGWVPAETLDIPTDPPPNLYQLTPEEIESYVNKQGLTSKSQYLLWVDIDRQSTYVLQGKAGQWRYLKTMQCATGQNVSPTIRGSFTIKDRGAWFYTDRFQSGARWWVRFEGPYLFHSVPMDKKGQILEPQLGQRASEGCIRLEVAEAKWVYDNIPTGTTVYSY